MSKIKSVFVFTSIFVGVIALMLSKHVVRSALFNLLSSLLAVLIGSVAGIVIFALILNFLEKKNFYGANLLSFDDFARKFLPFQTNDISNDVLRNRNFVSKVKGWFRSLSNSVKLILIKIVYRLANSPVIKDQFGNSTSSRGSASYTSVYELIRPYGETPDEMLMSSYGPNAISRSSSSICVSKKIDEIMHKVFEYTYRDYVETWYSKVSCDRGNFHRVLQADYWNVVKAFSERLSRLDTVNLIMKRFVNCIYHHIEEFKLTAKANPKDEKPSFTLHPCLRDRNTELTYLRHICDYILILTLPPDAARITSLRYILREVLAGLAFLPMVETMCDPDYINQTILMYFQSKDASQEEQTRAYAYAATYEEFIKIINDCRNVSILRQIRYRIMTEIIHATTISSLKKDQKKEGKARSMDKGELLLNRDLKRYINQCQVAKQQCEKKIRLLGGDDYGGKYSPGDNKSGFIESQLLTFEEIMSSALTRSYFLKYLRKIGKASLLKYWNEADLVKSTHPTGKDLAKIVSRMYQSYILPDSPEKLPFNIDKSITQGMQDCVLGNKVPADFFTVQKQVYDIMEKDHYPSFVVSDIYFHQMMPEITDKNIGTDSNTGDTNLTQTAFGGEESTNASLKRLHSIEEKLEYKAQALESIKSTSKVDRKVIHKLTSDISELQDAKWRQQLHMERTNVWWDNVGKWIASITRVQVSENEGPVTPLYTIIIHCSDVPYVNTTDDVMSWMVIRSLSEFHQLHQNLKDWSPWLKKQTLPKLPMFRLKGFSDKFLSESKAALAAFLTSIMQDDALRCSQIVYSFLSPGPEVAEVSTPDYSSRNSGVRLAENIGGFLRRFPKDVMDRVAKQVADEEDTDDLPEEDEESFSARDSVAEPLYRLISEIFEIHGLFRFLRRSLIVFVRVAFGRSINRQVRDMSDWLVSEPMVSFYLKTFLDSMWPDGQLAKPAAKRTDDEKLQTKLELQVKLLQNIPEALTSLIGQENTKHGFLKVFYALQDKRLNKHLFYNLLAESMEELFPEILQSDDKK